MIDFKLKDGDFIYENNDLVEENTDFVYAQCLSVILGTQVGSWFLDKELGVDYIDMRKIAKDNTVFSNYMYIHIYYNDPSLARKIKFNSKQPIEVYKDKVTINLILIKEKINTSIGVKNAV